MVEIGIGVATSKIANSFLEGKEAAQEIGYPLVIRPSYTLGGTGGGFVHKKEEFEAALSRGLQASPTHEVLVEQAVLGWKRSEEHTSELQSLMRISYAVFCLKKKNK